MSMLTESIHCNKLLEMCTCRQNDPFNRFIHVIICVHCNIRQFYRLCASINQGILLPEFLRFQLSSNFKFQKSKSERSRIGFWNFIL